MHFEIASNRFFYPLVPRSGKMNLTRSFNDNNLYFFLIFIEYFTESIGIKCWSQENQLKIEKHKKSFGELERHSSCATIYKIHTLFSPEWCRDFQFSQKNSYEKNTETKSLNIFWLISPGDLKGFVFPRYKYQKNGFFWFIQTFITQNYPYMSAIILVSRECKEQ